MNKPQLSPQEQVADLLLWSDPKTKATLKKIAKEKGVDLNALAELIDWQRKQQLNNRNNDRTRTFDDVLSNPNYWDKGE